MKIKPSECTSFAILHEITGYPSCKICIYPTHHAVTIKWLTRKPRRVNVPPEIDLWDWTRTYAFNHETTPKFYGDPQ